MNKNIIHKNLTDVIKDLSDHNDIADISPKFHYLELDANANKREIILKSNVIIFVIDGSCVLSYDKYLDRSVFGGEMIFIPRSSVLTAVVGEYAKLVYITFNTLNSASIRHYQELLWSDKQTMVYNFTPVKQPYPVSVFINSLVYLLQNGVENNIEFHEIKQQEIFFILRSFLTPEQFAILFYPIIGKSHNFRDFVLQNHNNCQKLEDLIELYGLSPNGFMRKFKLEFGVTAYQWMLKQKCQKIIQKSSQPGVTLQEVMLEIGINSKSHFNRFCRRHFGTTPKQFMAVNQRDPLYKWI